MFETQTTPAQPLPSKVRIISNALLDYAIDLFLPTVAYALLAPTRLSAVVRLTIGGFFVAAKVYAGRISGPLESEGHRHFGRAFAIGALIAALCTTVTITARVAGGSDSLASILGTIVLVAVQGINLLYGRRRFDGFALLVLVELAATIVLTSISNDPRLILMRPSFYTAIAGMYVLTTAWTARPLMMQVSKPIAARRDPSVPSRP
jgi:hypothetical protein